VWGNLGATVVRLIEARQPLLVSMRAGTVMSPLRTATGRAFAASLPQARVLAVGSGAVGDEHQGPAQRFSKADLAVLKASREDLRQHGLVRAEGRPIPSVNAFSAPAFDHEGQAAIVITTLGHQDEFDVNWDTPLAQRVRDAAQQISHRLGFQGQR
jgi:DNA-binding IclR family transcriptional regulator